MQVPQSSKQLRIISTFDFFIFQSQLSTTLYQVVELISLYEDVNPDHPNLDNLLRCLFKEKLVEESRKNKNRDLAKHLIHLIARHKLYLPEALDQIAK